MKNLLPMRTACAAVLTAALAGQSALADRTVLLFDTPATGFAEVLAQYGLQTNGGLADARVVDGQLQVFGTGSVNGHLLFAPAQGDYRFSFLASIGGNTPGFVNVGFTTGNRVLFIHPGYWANWFISEQPGDLGFVPDAAQRTLFNVTISTNGAVEVIVQNGQEHALLQFTDALYQPGVSRPGLSMGSVPGGYALFDELVITTVPEPAGWSLMALGLLGGAALRRARAQSSATTH